jgi:hypothetical protein
VRDQFAGAQSGVEEEINRIYRRYQVDPPFHPKRKYISIPKPGTPYADKQGGSSSSSSGGNAFGSTFGGGSSSGGGSAFKSTFGK